MRKFAPVVEFDGVALRRREWLRRPIARTAARRFLRRTRRLVASGAIIAVIGATLAPPILRIYTTGSSATETIPNGYATLITEGWGSGAGGGDGSGTGCNAAGGGGGGAGGFFKKTISVIGQGSKTLTYTVGVIAGHATPGNGTVISSGTLTISTLTANGGTQGGNGPTGAAGTGGTATNGDVNTTGANGTIGGNGVSGAPGGAGTAGSVTGDGSPYGKGGNGSNAGTGNIGVQSQGGAVIFFYA